MPQSSWAVGEVAAATPAESRVLLSGRVAGVQKFARHRTKKRYKMCIFLWNIHEVYELMFIVRNWVILGFFARKLLCWRPRECSVLRRGVAGRPRRDTSVTVPDPAYWIFSIFRVRN